MPRPARLLWALGAIVVVALLAAALAGALREPTTMPEGSPQRTVQRYVAAVLDGDVEQATALLSDDLARRCRAADFPTRFPGSPLTVTLDEVRIRDDRAEVAVRLRRDTGEPVLPIFETFSVQHFDLVRQGDEWVIDAEPWPVHFCPRHR